MKTILISAAPDGQGEAVFLLEGEKVRGGWIDGWFQPAAEALKVALPDAVIRFDLSCEAESRELWDSIEAFNEVKP